MNELSWTLLGDGASDDALLPILSWLLVQRLPGIPAQRQCADLRHLRTRPQGLRERIAAAIEFYPSDLLFVHRDAEREPAGNRRAEILEAVGGLAGPPVHVCVVPVRMTEAWCLFDEAAIRRAAGNPNGDMELEIPPLHQVESVPDPKALLRSVLRTASGLRGRRLKDFSISPRRVTALIDDFSPLRRLPAFRALEVELQSALTLMLPPQ